MTDRNASGSATPSPDPRPLLTPDPRPPTPFTRLVPNRPLPPYSYVPGQRPHPISNPAGHSFGQLAEDVASLNPDAWLSSGDYCWAIDLFNQGYYWEAHEAWEQLWIAAGRSGTEADFLKGLIKLAAAGVKLREGNPRGVKRHAARAGELLRLTQQRLGCEVTTYAGLQLDGLQRFAARVAGDEQAGLESPDGSRMLDPLPVADKPRVEPGNHTPSAASQ